MKLKFISTEDRFNGGIEVGMHLTVISVHRRTGEVILENHCSQQITGKARMMMELGMMEVPLDMADDLINNLEKIAKIKSRLTKTEETS